MSDSPSDDHRGSLRGEQWTGAAPSPVPAPALAPDAGGTTAPRPPDPAEPRGAAAPDATAVSAAIPAGAEPPEGAGPADGAATPADPTPPSGTPAPAGAEPPDDDARRRRTRSTVVLAGAMGLLVVAGVVIVATAPHSSSPARQVRDVGLASESPSSNALVKVTQLPEASTPKAGRRGSSAKPSAALPKGAPPILTNPVMPHVPTTGSSPLSHAAVGVLPVPQRPVAGYWPLTNGTPTSAEDLENQHDGIPSNVRFSQGCTNFNGTDSQITTDGPVLKTGPGQSFTVAVSVYAVKTDRTTTFVAQDGATNSAFYLQYIQSVQRWAFSRVLSDTPNPVPVQATSFSAPQWMAWTRLVGVYNGSTQQLRLYVNGVPQGTATDASPFGSNGPLTMGRAKYDSKPADWYNGSLNRVEVFQEALTAAQVKALN